jgi:tungstate transport system permease protein
LSFFEIIAEAFRQAIYLIVTGDPDVVRITLLSIYVSAVAIILASAWSIPVAMVLGLRTFPGKRFVRGVFNAFIGIPTVALGLFFYLILSKSGPLGFLGALYKPEGIIIGQAVLITPIIISFASSAIEAIDPDIRNLARTLGATESRASMTVLKEAYGPVMQAIVAGFNRAIAELGIAMMLGGNIRNVSRVLTTTIALETARGEIALSLALALILLTIVFGLSIALNIIRRE